MSSPDSLSAQHELGRTQTKRYASAVGRGLPPSIIEEARELAQAAEPYGIYADHKEDRFIYEMIETDGWWEKTRSWVDKWLEDEDNVRRAGRSVGRALPVERNRLRRAFCLFRLKELDSIRWWMICGGLGSDDHLPQTVVFVALEDLDPENGFFMHLKKGEDVCVDSMAQIRFPPMGGGLGIFFSLNI